MDFRSKSFHCPCRYASVWVVENLFGYLSEFVPDVTRHSWPAFQSQSHQTLEAKPRRQPIRKKLCSTPCARHTFSACMWDSMCLCSRQLCICMFGFECVFLCLPSLSLSLPLSLYLRSPGRQRVLPLFLLKKNTVFSKYIVWKSQLCQPKTEHVVACFWCSLGSDSSSSTRLLALLHQKSLNLASSIQTAKNLCQIKTNLTLKTKLGAIWGLKHARTRIFDAPLHVRKKYFTSPNTMLLSLASFSHRTLCLCILARPVVGSAVPIHVWPKYRNY